MNIRHDPCHGALAVLSTGQWSAITGDQTNQLALGLQLRWVQHLPEAPFRRVPIEAVS